MAENPTTARDFPHNTCPASRAAEMLADQLDAQQRACLIEDPTHAAGSIRSLVESLWQARADLNRIGAALLGEAKDDAPWWAETGKVVKAADGVAFISPDLRSAFDRYKASMGDGVDVSERVEASSAFNVVAFNTIAKVIEGESI